jgi:hypothetical protein
VIARRLKRRIYAELLKLNTSLLRLLEKKQKADHISTGETVVAILGRPHSTEVIHEDRHH